MEALSILDNQYWSTRYQTGQTGWDIGMVSTPLAAYIDQLSNTNLHILIPGCGRAYEAWYLLQKGFKNITLLDISETLTRQLKNDFAATPVQVLQGDFFEHTGTYDLILEQTFFCALPPQLRPDYVQHIHKRLRKGGKLVGILFNRYFDQSPPFGGSRQEYSALFGPHFKIITLAPCYNSIEPRSGTELFINFRKD
ncbi:MAG TPA: methyltransferase domain-containing protein [Phnomibacter sp.]|nr:methyltransferase domain-containing protein [Phnomibacter sp.]